jgi:hypothetical protein
MKSAIRFFALFVAVAGLASAALAPAATNAQPRHVSILASGPVTADVPGPETCSFDGCVVSVPGR